MKPTQSQFPEDDRPEGWDHLTSETMDEMEKHYAKEQRKDN